MKLTPQTLQQQLNLLKQPTAWLVAFSGGLDSTVLLHALIQTKQKIPITACYIDHGLQAISKDWIQHCQIICQQWQIPLKIKQLNLTPIKGESIEAIARTARYQVLQEYLNENEILLTAQHADDQVETVLLQLLRGSGVEGLSAMPSCKPFGQGLHARPLLPFSKADLKKYALAENLIWIEDPSNQETCFDRNYLRQKVIPLLKNRWQGLTKTIPRSAQLCAEAAQLNQQSAQQYLQADILNHFKLADFSQPQQRLILRQWFIQQKVPQPNQRRLNQIQQLIAKQRNARALVEWQNIQLRVYHQHFYLMPKLNPFDSTVIIHWKVGVNVLKLPANLGKLKRINSSLPLEIRFRQGGEGRILKKIFQEKKVLPWMRDQIPLIYNQNKLIQIGDLKKQSELEIQWIKESCYFSATI